MMQMPNNTRLRKWEDSVKRMVANTIFPTRIATDLVEHDYFSKFMVTGGYFITGAVGSGKTTLACRMLLHVAEQRYLAKQTILDAVGFWSVPSLLQDIRSCYWEHSKNLEGPLLSALIETPYIVLDDLGVEKTTEWVLQTLYLIISARYDSAKVTIITSNLSLDKLAEKLGDRIASRIAGMSEIITLTETDHRVG